MPLKKGHMYNRKISCEDGGSVEMAQNPVQWRALLWATRELVNILKLFYNHIKCL